MEIGLKIAMFTFAFFRYTGYVDVVKGLVRLGLLSPEPNPYLHIQVITKFIFRLTFYKILTAVKSF